MKFVVDIKYPNSLTFFHLLKKYKFDDPTPLFFLLIFYNLNQANLCNNNNKKRFG